MEAIQISLCEGELTEHEQKIVDDGFSMVSAERMAPAYEKKKVCWKVHSSQWELIGALTGYVLWDWLYIEKLWCDQKIRGQGIGKELMLQAEQYAANMQSTGLWLWTQSWQAEDFYKSLGYDVFTRFEDFPKGHSRIGLRKKIIV